MGLGHVDPARSSSRLSRSGRVSSLAASSLFGVAGLSSFAALLSLPAYPFWSLAIFAVDLLVIYGLAAYGGQHRANLSSDSDDAAAVAAEQSSFEGARRAGGSSRRLYMVGLEEEVMLLGSRHVDAGDDACSRCLATESCWALRRRTRGRWSCNTRMPPSPARSPSWWPLRAGPAHHAGDLGLATAVADMHPAPMAENPRVSRARRYQNVQRTTARIARREPTFALHVHIGVAHPESAIRLLNRLRAHLPLLLALCSWRGQATGLASKRPSLSGLPRTGLPRVALRATPTGWAASMRARLGAIPEPTFLWADA